MIMTAYLANHSTGGIDLISIIHQSSEDQTLRTYKTQKLLRNEFLYTSPPDNDSIFIVKEGRIKIGTSDGEEKEIIKRVVGKGEMFGAFSIMGHRNQKDYAMAMEATEVYTLTSKELLNLIPDSNNLSQFFMQLLGNRLMDMEQRLEEMVFKTSRSRIITFLDKLVAKKGQRIGYEMLVRKFFTHQEIASLTATSRQTVTSVLNDLRSRNILTFNRRRLLVRDMDLLRAEVN